MCEFKPGDQVVTPAEGHSIGTVRKIFLEIEFPETKRNWAGLMQPKRKVTVAEPFVHKASGSCKAEYKLGDTIFMCGLAKGHPREHIATVPGQDNGSVHFS